LPPIPTKRWRSLGHALDFRETAREIWVGCLYMFDKVKGKEPRVDVGPRRAVHYERAFGRERLLPDKPRTRGLSLDQSYREKPQPTLPPVEIEVYRELDIEGERQWMKFGRNSVLNPRRERSEALQDQIDHELEKRGYPSGKLKAHDDSDPLTDAMISQRQGGSHRRLRKLDTTRRNAIPLGLFPGGDPSTIAFHPRGTTLKTALWTAANGA